MSENVRRDAGSVTIEQLVVTDPVVLAAADDFDGDLGEFVTQALSLGARTMSAISTTGATQSLTAAVDAARTSTEEAVQRATQKVQEANDAVAHQITTLFGGESPELLDRLRPVLDRQIADAVRAAQRDLLDTQRQQHADLTSLVRDVRQEVAVAAAASQATVAAQSSTTAKGGPFEDQVNEVMQQIAVGQGDDYLATTTTVGTIAHCKKGDGVLVVDGGARVVIESHNGSTKDWMPYLDEAERNRSAAASLGIVKTPDQNAGHIFRRLSPTRVILAFDPQQDNTDLLRAVVQFVRHIALSLTTVSSDADVALADSHLSQALAALDALDETKRMFSLIHRHADNAERSVERAASAVHKHLAAAAKALSGEG